MSGRDGTPQALIVEHSEHVLFLLDFMLSRESYAVTGCADGREADAFIAGPLADQVMRNFRPNATGRLWQLEIGDETALLLLDKPATNPGGANFARSHDVAVPASKTTFHNQRRRLDELSPELSLQWSAWPAFKGIALHEYVTDRAETGATAIPERLTN